MKRLKDYLYNLFLSDKSSHKAEVFIIWLSIASFIIHLLLILMNHFGLIPFLENAELLQNPISAIYTPFSFILLYEVYLLVYYIPQSTSNYVAKQYEIITLIVVRRLFKDIANLDFQQDWFNDAYDLQFTYDIIATLILFILIYFFHSLNRKDNPKAFKELSSKTQKFVKRKRLLAILLVPVIILMAIYSLVEWLLTSLDVLHRKSDAALTNMNNIFFDEFFALLILTDVLLLLLSFFNTSRFNVVLRNSGFIISTILIRLSFSAEGYLNNILIITAVTFGVLILWINRKYEKI